MVHQIDMFVLQAYIPYSKFEFFAFDLYTIGYSLYNTMPSFLHRLDSSFALARFNNNLDSYRVHDRCITQLRYRTQCVFCTGLLWVRR